MKKNLLANISLFFIFIIVILFSYFQSLTQNWSSIIDFDLTVIFNSLQVISGYEQDFREHPVKDLIDLEFNVSINTDNRLMSNTSINKEIDIAKNLGINNIDNILNKSARYSFLNNF